MKGKIELYNISFLILKVELHFNIYNAQMVTHYKYRYSDYAATF